MTLQESRLTGGQCQWPLDFGLGPKVLEKSPIPLLLNI